MPQSFCVGPGMRVTLSYTLRDEDGDIVEEAPSDEPVSYIHGFGQVLPALERQAEGLFPGATRTFTLSPEEGYGEHDPDGLFQVPRSEFPDPHNIPLDEEFAAEGPDGEETILRVVEWMDDDHVLVDSNHPLAGVTLSFELTIHAVEPAPDDELEQAEQALLEREGAPPAPGAGLIQLGRKPRSPGSDT